MKTKKKKFSFSRLILYIFLIALAVISFVPFYIMLISSTQTNTGLASRLSLIPGTQFLANYHRMMARVNIWTGLKNSILVSTSATVLAAYFGALTAYGFAKFKFKGNGLLFAVVLVALMVPPQLGILGFYRVCRFLNIVDSRWALILPAIATANIVFFIKLYIDSTVPDSLIEAARIDGCGEFKIFNKVILPIIVPSVATMSIFTFITSWNTYLTPLIVLNSEEKYTVPLLTALAKGVYQTDFGAVYVCITMSMLPIMIVFLFCSKYIIGGLTVGSIKG
ncbi:carbohydrate ABC transporter permease [Clostridium oryzae]|uniref:L-arabinose transport system permease protein AraQ n=1 Tax=Clostridium oryzae TaxID=1450648 RepID=A0A1V4IND6_9CLOT|nr:carbohydrate ABC transporter permease [Clostridium oryzae]OPJ61551.1 L-arabinose transport system permease protein AraQ [Clostridium oryzae]